MGMTYNEKQIFKQRILAHRLLLREDKIPAIPRAKWPFWAKALKAMAKPEDKGIGDVVARLIGDENSEQFKSWYKATFNKDCGCKGRQARWNRIYPLK